MLSPNESRVVRRSLDRVSCPVADIGSDIEVKYRKEYDINGNASFVPVQEFSVREFISSFRTGCSLRSILERCSLLPTNEKIRYLQNNEDGFSADMTNLPKDGTEAFLMLQEMQTKYPDITERMRNGESLDSIISALFGKGAETEKADSAEQIVKNDESEEK